MGRRSWRARCLAGAAMDLAVFVPAFWDRTTCVDGSHCRHRRSTGGFVHQRHLTRHWRQGHGRNHPRTWGNTGPCRQPHLCRTPVPAHGGLLLSNLVNMQTWRYEPASDLDQPMIERLRRFPREPDMLVYALRSLAALTSRGWLKLYH